MGDNIAVPVIAGLAAGLTFVILFAPFALQLPSLPRNVYWGLYMVEADGSKTDITPIKEEEEKCQNCIVLQVWEPESYVRKTGKSAVKAEFLVDSVTIQRGSYADVPLLLTHVGGINAEPYVTVRVMPPVGYTLYPKSVAEASTEEERFEAAKAGTMLYGGIDMAQFVAASDPVNIGVGSEQIVNVRFVVPASIPDEVNGIFVPIQLEMRTQSGSRDAVSGENTGIELIVAS